MTGDASFDVQTAIYARLTSSSPRIADGNIYDDVPQDVEFPYVQIGESVYEEADVDTKIRTDETVTLYVYSRYRGQKEIKDIVSLIKDEFHKTTLAVSGRDALIWWGGSLTRLDPDGVTRQGIIRLNIISGE